MKKTEINLNILTALFCVTLIVANVVAGKVLDTGIWLFSTTIAIPGAVMCYPVTYLITDIVGELWGKKVAGRIVWTGFAAQVISTLIITVTQYLPTTNPEMQNAYTMLLGQNWIFVIGSLAAYLISQKLDVTIFHGIRNRYIRKRGSTKGGRWLWNNGSTMTSQLVDTAVFSCISFGIGFGWLWSNPQALINMIIGQYLVKLAIAALDTPFFYFFTRKREG